MSVSSIWTKPGKSSTRKIKGVGDSLERIAYSFFTALLLCSAYIRFQLNVGKIETHHRGTEDTEGARRLESYSSLCAPSVLSVSAVVNVSLHTLNCNLL